MSAPPNSPEIWMHLFPTPGRCVEQAVWAEAAGFHGILLADSQNLVGDPFVELGIISSVTSSLQLGTGVVNPTTRHPAVVAAAIATVQRESGGRAVLGVGRGDSALAQLGLRHPTTRELGDFVDAVRAYLRGEPVTRPGGESRLQWLGGQADQPVPVEVAATGPRTIELAATRSDRVMLTVGAAPERIAACIARAREARRSAGLDPAELRVGAYVNVACSADLATACDLVRGSTAIFARFSGLASTSATGMTADDAAVISHLAGHYDEARHGLGDARHAQDLPDDFVKRFAIVGPADACIDRLGELFALGLDRVVVVSGSRDADPAVLAQAEANFAERVLPSLTVL